ncbi:conserved hypothetical protein [Tenacibaculum litopenaei]|uniref:thioredoxin family protein n=1 Tax=Tenacibaculum litopenaei TaxID=396016 RepID=UPI0038956067
MRVPVFLWLFFVSLPLIAQSKAVFPKVYSPQEAFDQQETQYRPIVFFFHADWCKYCKAMEIKTLQNKEVVRLLDAHYYFVMMKDTYAEEVRIKGQVFRLPTQGKHAGVHDLLRLLATKDGVLSYPSTVLLGKDYQIDEQISSFMTANQLVSLLQKYLEKSSN